MHFSIITSVGVDYVQFLPELAESVANLRLPSDASVEWLVWFDGLEVSTTPNDSGIVFASLATSSIASVLPEFLRPVIDVSERLLVVIGTTGRRSNSFVARNHALAYASGDVVLNVDADDVLLPAALETIVRGRREHTSARWFAGAADVMDHGGRTIGSSGPLMPTGMTEPHAVFEAWSRLDAPPVHPGGFCADLDLLLAVGGWGAVSAAGDTMMLLAVTSLAPGVVSSEPVFAYRRWDGSVSRSAWKAATTSDRHRLMRRRVEAMRRLTTTSLL